MRLRLTVLAIATAAIASCLGAGPASAASCPNEALRTGLSALLPACRAYEKVTPSEKGGVGINRQDTGNFPGGVNSSALLVNPDGISYVAGGAFAGTEVSTGHGLPYYSLRGADGWSTRPLGLPVSPPVRPFQDPVNLAVSDDGSRSITETAAKLLPSAQECPEYLNCTTLFYLHEAATNTNRLITRTPVENPAAQFATRFFGTTPDLTRVVFTANARLLPEATPGVFNAYEWIDDGTETGELKLIGREPGTDAPFMAEVEIGSGSETISDNRENRRVLSLDGRQVVFNSGGRLYARIDGTRTVPVSASQRTPVDPEGPQLAVYRTAEATHGSSIYFTSEEKLTDDSKAVVEQKGKELNEFGEEVEVVLRPGEPDLYRFDVATEKLTDITVTGPGAGGVLGVIGASSDGNSVYFAATGQLVPGQGTPGERNIYLWRNDGTAHGSLTYVTTIAPPIDRSGPEAPEITFEFNWWTPGTGYQGEQVSENGRYLVLTTKKPLTGYPTANTFQVYRYDAATGLLLCASCDPTVAASTGRSSLPDILGGPRADKPRSVSDGGVVGFQSDQGLTPTDTNGVQDAYFFDGGAPQLISSGKGSLPSAFLGMTPSGRDFYFNTSAQMVNSDTDELVDIYDAREGGGIVEPTRTAGCGTNCRGAGSTPATVGEPGSRGLDGSGNLARDCTVPRHQAKRLRIRARRLEARAKRTGASKRARQLGKQSTRLRKQAHQLDLNAKRCIATNGRAGK